MGVALPRSAFLQRSLLTPACGMGSTSEAVAERVLALLAPTRQAVASRRVSAQAATTRASPTRKSPLASP